MFTFLTCISPIFSTLILQMGKLRLRERESTKRHQLLGSQPDPSSSYSLQSPPFVETRGASLALRILTGEPCPGYPTLVLPSWLSRQLVDLLLAPLWALPQGSVSSRGDCRPFFHHSTLMGGVSCEPEDRGGSPESGRKRTQPWALTTHQELHGLLTCSHCCCLQQPCEICPFYSCRD